MKSKEIQELMTKSVTSTGAVIGVVIFAVVVALMTGLLVWHFHFRKNEYAKRIYIGSMKIQNQAFDNAYENSDTPEFKALAEKVQQQVRLPGSLTQYMNTFFYFYCLKVNSEGVVAYYMSEFKVPVGEEKSVDGAIAVLNQQETRGFPMKGKSRSNLEFTDMKTSGNCHLLSKFKIHTEPDRNVKIETTGFPAKSYEPNTFTQWELRGDEGTIIKLEFDAMYLEENCSNDFVKIYDSLVPIENRALEELCGDHQDGNIFEIGTTNKMTLEFLSDHSYVDRGFQAEYEAIDPVDPCPGKFHCRNGLCISQNLTCDGWNDCGDMSDEKNCRDSLLTCGSGLCKPLFWKCDGVDDCGDGTDERDCGACETGYITCTNKKCVSEKKQCDGKDDCGDNSDELNCKKNSEVQCTESTYKCKNGKCIDKKNPVCDGSSDCEDGSDEENCACGRKKLRSSTRIVGGEDAAQGEFPWQVSLHFQTYGHVCGASIISENWLVTAAHCVQSDPAKWEVYLGLHDQRKIESFVVKRKLKQIISNPNYNPNTFNNDIALMELDSPIKFSDYIQPICLPNNDYKVPVGETVFITGFGATREGGTAAKVLQKAEVRIINYSECNKLMSYRLTSKMFCAGVLTGGVDACQGDSGGPLNILEGDYMLLAGVVSWGDGCARRNKPGIYTTVSEFRGWIKEKTGV
uniref:ST14 transmembrane serine protease matriptase a n=1 Tax=Poecilia reticulata TaxID=8081 RepID=A0A3P9PTK9_POERE